MCKFAGAPTFYGSQRHRCCRPAHCPEAQGGHGAAADHFAVPPKAAAPGEALASVREGAQSDGLGTGLETEEGERLFADLFNSFSNSSKVTCGAMTKQRNVFLGEEAPSWRRVGRRALEDCGGSSGRTCMNWRRQCIRVKLSVAGLPHRQRAAMSAAALRGVLVVYWTTAELGPAAAPVARRLAWAAVKVSSSPQAALVTAAGIAAGRLCYRLHTRRQSEKSRQVPNNLYVTCRIICMLCHYGA